MRILHVAAESTPFVKTGGLGDVIGACRSPAATGPRSQVLLPGYPAVLQGLSLRRAGCDPSGPISSHRRAAVGYACCAPATIPRWSTT
ncbi:MAG: glycogen/starch synthase [Burkholderiaceae bacterium]